MPKNGSKTGKSSKTARVLSLLTDPAASLLGGSRNHTDNQDDETELMDETPKPSASGLNDAATESRIHDSLAAQEDELMGLFGKQEPARARPAPRQEEPPQLDNAPTEDIPPQEDAPDPRTMELLSMLSNPSTLGNSAMPMPDSRRPAALDMDFAEELTAGLDQQPEPPAEEPAPQPAQQAYTPPTASQPMQQAYTPPTASQPMQQAYTPPTPSQPAQQAYTPPTASQPMQHTPPTASQPMQQPYAVQAASQPAQQAVSRASSPADHALKKQEEFVCFNLTQALVEDKADKLMKQFGMCTCNRCRVDVTALALSNLPAKYVAMQNRDILPLLSMYEEKYSAAVTVQVMSACRMVMNRPHHGR